MSVHKEVKKVTTHQLQEMKRRGEAEEAAGVPLKPRKKGDLIPN